MSFPRTSPRALARLLSRLFGSSRRVSASLRDVEPRVHEQLIQRILNTIHNNSILLCGKAGSGKTAALLELKSRLSGDRDPGTDFYPVYIDLKGVSENTFFATVAAAVFEQIAHLNATGPACCGADYGHRDLAHDFRSIVRTLKKRGRGHPRLVLLMDGIDELNTYAPRTTQRVRSLFMLGLDGSLVMVGTAVEIDKHWVEEGSPWYNFFEEIQLTTPDNEESKVSRPG